MEGKGSNNKVNQPSLWSRKGSTFSLSLNTIIKQYKTLLLVVKNNKLLITRLHRPLQYKNWKLHFNGREKMFVALVLDTMRIMPKLLQTSMLKTPNIDHALPLSRR